MNESECVTAGRTDGRTGGRVGQRAGYPRILSSASLYSYKSGSESLLAACSVDPLLQTYFQKKKVYLVRKIVLYLNAVKF